MAIELGKVNVTDLTENDYKVLGIGINRSSNSNGTFATNYTTLNQAKDNLKNLILTKKSVYFKIFSGKGGIRTPGSLATTSVFKTDAFNRSATFPGNRHKFF